MKKYRRTLATLALLMLLNGCAANAQTIETEPPTMAATESAVRPPAEESGPPPTEETNPVIPHGSASQGNLCVHLSC